MSTGGKTHLYESQGSRCWLHIHTEVLCYILQRTGVDVLYLHREDVYTLRKAPTNKSELPPV